MDASSSFGSSTESSGFGIGNRPVQPQERRCTFGKLQYEKITGNELIRANPVRLFSRREGGITKDCARRCESDSRCLGFNMDYNRNECQAVSKNSENNLFNLRSSTGVSYFEAICLRGNACGLQIILDLPKTYPIFSLRTKLWSDMDFWTVRWQRVRRCSPRNGPWRDQKWMPRSLLERERLRVQICQLRLRPPRVPLEQVRPIQSAQSLRVQTGNGLPGKSMRIE